MNTSVTLLHTLSCSKHTMKIMLSCLPRTLSWSRSVESQAWAWAGGDPFLNILSRLFKAITLTAVGPGLELRLRVVWNSKISFFTIRVPFDPCLEWKVWPFEWDHSFIFCIGSKAWHQNVKKRCSELMWQYETWISEQQNLWGIASTRSNALMRSQFVAAPQDCRWVQWSQMRIRIFWRLHIFLACKRSRQCCKLFYTCLLGKTATRLASILQALFLNYIHGLSSVVKSSCIDGTIKTTVLCSQ